eukprot:1091246-Amphidinium_carterae.1
MGICCPPDLGTCNIFSLSLPCMNTIPATEDRSGVNCRCRYQFLLAKSSSEETSQTTNEEYLRKQEQVAKDAREA